MKLICQAACATALLVAVTGAACSGDDDTEVSPPTGATTSPTAAPPNADEAESVFRQFQSAVLDGELDRAWSLYTASVEGTTDSFVAEYGCEYVSFGAEFAKIQHLFERLNPLEITGTFGNAPFSVFVEFTMSASTGEQFLVTLTRVQPYEPYRLRWFNSGQTAPLSGVPNPQPSLEDPQGFCGIWTGPR